MNTAVISKMDNELERFISVYRSNIHDVVLYGAGEGADWAIKLLSKISIIPSKIVDKVRWGGVKEDISIISHKELVEMYHNKFVYILVTSPKYESEIMENLRGDFLEDNIFSFEYELYCNYINDINAYRNYLEKNQLKFDRLYSRLEDDFSRRTLENVLMGRMSGKLKYFKEVSVSNQYFPDDIVKLNKDEVFIDAGAFTGDTAENIVKVTEGNYNKIYCFEPDKKCLQILYNNIKNYKNIEVVEKGAWHKSEKLRMSYDSEHGSSKIDEEGKSIIELDCIDNCIASGQRITYIKMDIEGAELKALLGCERVIRECRPKLAICVYHRNEDLLDITNYILTLIPDYKLFLRHHNVSGTETVLYAI